MITQPASLECLDVRQAGSPALWSLLDMLRFYAVSFAAAMAALERAEMSISLERLAVAEYPRDGLLQQRVRDALDDLAKATGELPQSVAIKPQLSYLTKFLDRSDLTVDANALRKV